jgi:hypothetical protein
MSKQTKIPSGFAPLISPSVEAAQCMPAEERDTVLSKKRRCVNIGDQVTQGEQKTEKRPRGLYM